ncbi:hypothetical protein Tco_0589366 [Tanacetum coccineum]
MLKNPVVTSSQGWYPTYMDMGECDQVCNIWKTFGGNTRDLGSILEEIGQECNFTQRRLEELLTEGGDGIRITCNAVWMIKRPRQRICDGVWTVAVIKKP